MKPHIRLLGGTWVCYCARSIVRGFGDTPGEAYRNWVTYMA